MNGKAWDAFCAVRDEFKTYCRETEKKFARLGLREAQQRLADSRTGPRYTVETPVVYNRALDDINADSGIALIFAADNPGRREQAAENRRYLVGPSGKIAEGFFRNNPELGIDFRANVIIVNKTPVHTPRTIELKELCALGGEQFAPLLEETQETMARLTLDFQKALSIGRAKPVPVWISGYSEMKRGGVFERYTATIRRLYAEEPELAAALFLYRHFSMNQFTIDLNKQRRPDESTAAALERIGSAYRERILAAASSSSRPVKR